MKYVVGRPIAFASTGERPDDFELFHPDRMASRILGMGDVLTLIERAERDYDEDVAEQAMERLRSGRFTLEDFHEQLQQMKKMGPSAEHRSVCFPGCRRRCATPRSRTGTSTRIEAIIRSMTPAERDDPIVINGSRRLADRDGQWDDHDRCEQPAPAVQGDAEADALVGAASEDFARAASKGRRRAVGSRRR